MVDLLHYKTWMVLAAFVLLFLAERLWPAAKPQLETARRLIKNLAFWPLNLGLSLLVVLPLSFWVASHALWPRPEGLSGGWGLVADILLLDMFLYFWHRAVHEIPFLWRFHEVHHLDRHLDTTSALRFHSGEIFFATLVRAGVIFVFAVPFASVLVFEGLVLVFTLFHHSNWRLNGRLERVLSNIIITPSLHWVHHHAKRTDTDANYGTLFSFWDKLFKSKSPTPRTPNMTIGVEGRGGKPLKDRPFLSLLLLPFGKR